jgi:type IV pilus assembly protein PilY1
LVRKLSEEGTDAGPYAPGSAADDGYYRTGAIYPSYDFGRMGKSSGIEWDTYIRFQNVTVPQGATINSARIDFVSFQAESGTACNTNIFFNDSDDAVAPTTYQEYEALVRTTAFVAWDGISAWVREGEYSSPDISTVVQEVVDRGSWSSGNAMMLIWENDASDNNAIRVPVSYEDELTEAKLYINYSE